MHGSALDAHLFLLHQGYTKFASSISLWDELPVGPAPSRAVLAMPQTLWEVLNFAARSMALLQASHNTGLQIPQQPWMTL